MSYGQEAPLQALRVRGARGRGLGAGRVLRGAKDSLWPCRGLRCGHPLPQASLRHGCLRLQKTQELLYPDRVFTFYYIRTVYVSSLTPPSDSDSFPSLRAKTASSDAQSSILRSAIATADCPLPHRCATSTALNPECARNAYIRSICLWRSPSPLNISSTADSIASGLALPRRLSSRRDGRSLSAISALSISRILATNPSAPSATPAMASG